MRLIQLLLQYSPKVVILAIITGIIAGLSNAGLLAIINTAIAQFPIIHPGLAIGFVALCLLLMVSSTGAQILLAKLSQEIVHQLLLQLTQSILNCPFQQLETVGSPKLMAVLTKDVEAISSASAIVSGLCINFALLLGCMGYLAGLSLPAFLCFMSFLGFGMFITNLILRRARQELRQAREDQDRLFKNFEGITQGIKELKLHYFRRRTYYEDEITPNSAAYRDRWIKGMIFFSWAGGLGLVLFFIPLGFMLFVLPQLMILSTSLLSSFALIIIFMLMPLRSILLGLPQLSQANISLEKVESLGLTLAQYANTGAIAVPKSRNASWQQLDFKQVSHTYFNEKQDHNFTLGPFSLSLYPAEIIFIVGGNGSGKSTLIKLLTGLYIPESGEILHDGKSITDQNRDLYRQLFSAIFSDYYLFDQMLGLESQDLDSKAQFYLKQLELNHKVQVVDGYFSTTNLSQGQRKRLALVTAYLENRSIYVFDEWASDQDPIFKEVFYRQLLPALQREGKTVVVVSHDDRYFPNSNDLGLAESYRIIKLEEGQVRELDLI